MKLWRYDDRNPDWIKDFEIVSMGIMKKKQTENTNKIPYPIP